MAQNSPSLWENIGNFRSAVMQGSGPRQRREMNQQNLDMNALKLSGEQLTLAAQRGVQAAIAGGWDEEQISQYMPQVMKANKILSDGPISEDVAQKMFQFQLQQAQKTMQTESQAQQMAAEKHKYDIFGKVQGAATSPDMANISPDAQMQLLGNLDTASGGALTQGPEGPVDLGGFTQQQKTDLDTGVFEAQTPTGTMFLRMGADGGYYDANSQQPYTGEVTELKKIGTPSSTTNVYTGNVEKSTKGAVEQKYLDTATARENLKTVMDDYKESFSTVGGQMFAGGIAKAERVGLDKLAEKFGTNTAGAKKYLADYTAWAMKGKQYFNLYRQEITKSQASMKEIEFLQSSTIDVENDSSTQLLSKFKQLDEIGQRVQNRRKIFLQMGIESPSQEQIDAITENEAPDSFELSDQQAKEIADLVVLLKQLEDEKELMQNNPSIGQGL